MKRHRSSASSTIAVIFGVMVCISGTPLYAQSEEALPPEQAGTFYQPSAQSKTDRRPGTLDDVRPDASQQIADEDIILASWASSKSRAQCPPVGFLRTRLIAQAADYPSADNWSVSFTVQSSGFTYLIEGEAYLDSDDESEESRRARLQSTWATLMDLPDLAPGAYGVTGPIGQHVSTYENNPYGTEGLSTANIYIPGVRCRYRLISNVQDDVHLGLMKNIRRIAVPLR